MNILIVDDEEDVCRTLSLILTRHGYTCQTAANGAEALKKCSEQTFDVVLTDRGMPGMNGLELAEQIKAQMPQTRIILITGWPGPLTADEQMRSGIEGILTKPISKTDLLNALTSKP